MKNKLQKIPAFTLSELLVAMAISAIVIGLSSGILNLVFKNVQSIQSNYADSTEISLLEQQLTVDFNQFHNINFEEDLETLKLKNEIDSISYYFGEKYLLRSLDTIQLNRYTKHFFYQGGEVLSGEVDAIRIEFEEKNTFVFCFRENDAFEILSTNGN